MQTGNGTPGYSETVMDGFSPKAVLVLTIISLFCIIVHDLKP